MHQMIIRIVKMSFHPQHRETFRALFASREQQIRHFPGCLHLELWEEHTGNGVFFTCSHWSGAEALEAYRLSPLFNDTWAATKILFNAKPEAWSLHKTHPAP